MINKGVASIFSQFSTEKENKGKNKLKHQSRFN